MWLMFIDFRLQMAPKEEIAGLKIGRTCGPMNGTAMRDDVLEMSAEGSLSGDHRLSIFQKRLYDERTLCTRPLHVTN
jgi:hypothetical protein